MGKTRNKSRSEIEYLRGRIRELETELKYYKRREHFFDDRMQEIDEVQDVKVVVCKNCKRGAVMEYDFIHGILKKCDICGHQEYKKKK